MAGPSGGFSGPPPDGLLVLGAERTQVIPVMLGLGSLIARVAAVAVIPRVVKALSALGGAKETYWTNPVEPVKETVSAPAQLPEKVLYGRSLPTAHKYRYCGNNPMALSDPSGLCPPRKKKELEELEKLIKRSRIRTLTLDFRWSRTSILHLRIDATLPPGAAGARFVNATLRPQGSDPSGLSQINIPSPSGSTVGADVYGNIEYVDAHGNVVNSEEFIPHNYDVGGGFQGIPFPYRGEGYSGVEFE